MFNLSSVIDTTLLSDDEYCKRMNITKCKKSDDYFIVKYDKKHIIQNVKSKNNQGKLRSVIFKNDKCVCYSPPKSLNTLEFFKEIDTTNEEIMKKLTLEEFVEGTMCNMFFDGENWEIATRSLIGGKGYFFKNYNVNTKKSQFGEDNISTDESQNTFRNMFIECFIKAGLEFDYFNPKFCYSFVIQHPKNRIVAPVTHPKIVLCKVYEITNQFIENKEQTIIKEIDIYDENNYMIVKSNEENEYIIHKPNQIIIPNTMFTKMVEKNTNENGGLHIKISKTFMEYLNTIHFDDYTKMGIMISDGMVRTKIRNGKYEEIRRLRGNNQKSQFHYLSLRNNGMVGKFLKYYPEYSDEFRRYQSQIHSFTKDLYHHYVDCFIYKTKKLSLYPYQYRSHMYELHNIYLNHLRPEQRKMQIDVVIHYINTLEPARLMYSINYVKREIETKENETQQTANDE